MRSLYITVFLVSASVLIFEVSLSRFFSISLWYHFAFMVISIAMLGLGSAGTLLALFTGEHEKLRSGSHNSCVLSSPILSFLFSEYSIALYAALTGISFFTCYNIANHIPFEPVRFSWENRQFLYLVLYCLTLSLPFFFSGLVIATAFYLRSEKAMQIYGWDLFGAGTGSMAALFLLDHGSPGYALSASSVLCLLGALSSGNKNIRVVISFFLLIFLSVIMARPAVMDVRISPYKGLSLALDYPGARHLDTYHSSYSRIDTLRSPAVRFAPGLSLKYLDSLPDQIGFSVDAGDINAITDGRDESGLRFLEFLPSSLVYRLRSNSSVLLLDPKGGLPVIMARYFGASLIHSAESNPLILEILRSDFDHFSGGIVDKNVYTGYGRNYLQGLYSSNGSEGSYGVIDLSLTDAVVGGNFGISEDYRYTVEAFVQYFSALQDKGIISVSLYLIPPPRTEFRLAATIVSALKELHIDQPSSRLIAIRSWDSMTILAGKSPFTYREIEQVKEFCRAMGFDLVYYPGIKEGESNTHIKLISDDYFTGFTKLLDNSMRKPFLDDYLFDIQPVHDDNPFFHYYLDLENITQIYEKMGRKLLYFIEEGYVLPVLLFILVLLSLLLIMLPVFIHALRSGRYIGRRTSYPVPLFMYFSLLGLGFMFVEVTLIHRNMILFESPPRAVAIILSVLLVSSGVGSMISSRSSVAALSRSLPILSSALFVYAIIQPFLINLLASCPLYFRICIISLSLLPVGVFMGIPFPLGIRLLGNNNESLIPWAWAINSCLSVLAPVITIALALLIGFRPVFCIGALSYLFAYYYLNKLKML